MNKLDDKISQALSEDERRLIEQMPDYKNIFTLMAGSFRSKMRPFLILGLILGTLVTAFCVYAIVQVFQAETTKLQILWSLVHLGRARQGLDVDATRAPGGADGTQAFRTADPQPPGADRPRPVRNQPRTAVSGFHIRGPSNSCGMLKLRLSMCSHLNMLKLV